MQQIVLEIFLTSGCGAEHAALRDCSVGQSIIVTVAFINYNMMFSQLFIMKTPAVSAAG